MSAIRKQNITKMKTEYTLQQDEISIGAARKKKLLYRRLSTFIICASVIGFFMITTLISQSSILEGKAAEKKELDKKISLLEKQEDELNEQIVKLNDEEYLAKLARKDLFLSEEGEIIFNISSEKEEDSE